MRHERHEVTLRVYNRATRRASFDRCLDHEVRAAFPAQLGGSLDQGSIMCEHEDLERLEHLGLGGGDRYRTSSFAELVERYGLIVKCLAVGPTKHGDVTYRFDREDLSHYLFLIMCCRPFKAVVA